MRGVRRCWATPGVDARARLRWALVGLFTLRTAAALAQPVAVSMSDCPSVSASEVRAVLAVELQGQLAREESSVPPRVQVQCSERSAELWLQGTPVRRSLSLGSVPPELRARLLALSIAELVRPQPLAAAPPPAAVPPLRAAEPALPGRRIWLGFAAQAAPIVGLGGALSFDMRVGEWLAWSSTLGLLQARAGIDRGELRVLSLSVRSGLALQLQGVRGSLQLGAGLHGRRQGVEGVPSDVAATRAARFTVWSLGPALFAGASWQLGRHVLLALALELDRLREVRARVEGGQTERLSAWHAGAVLGAGVAW